MNKRILNQIFLYNIISIFICLLSSSCAFKLNVSTSTSFSSTSKISKFTIRHTALSPKYNLFDPLLAFSKNYNQRGQHHQQQEKSYDIDDINDIINVYNGINSYESSFDNPTQCGTRIVQYQTNRHHRRGKIIGGYEAQYGAFPWQVQIQIFNSEKRVFEHNCSGALIDNKVVITAAHCLQISQLDMLRLVLGNHFLTKKDLFEHGFRVDFVLIHPEYRKQGLYSNDIGLLKIRTPYSFGIPFNSHIRSICLPNHGDRPPEGTWCSVTGWGVHNGGNPLSVANVLREAAVPILDLNMCRKDSINGSHKQEILDTMLCAGFLQGGVDACSGDSGGPLACEINGRFILYGIVSWGDGCAERCRPGVYTRIDIYSNWIRDAIHQMK